MDNTKIDWADATWNPITGCLHGCKYCYARRIAERFGLSYAPRLGDPGMEGACKYDTPEGMDTMLELEKPYVGYKRKEPYPMAFFPTFHRYRLDIPSHWKKPRNIFVCSMADLFGDWVPDEWIRAVFDACEAAPQHRYLFLTKNPKRYQSLKEKGMLPEKHWYGYSATRERDVWAFDHADDCPCRHLFISIEPIFGSIDAPLGCSHLPADWVVIGAETGNGKEKIKPKREWVEGIYMHCKHMGVPVFMKESLRDLMGGDFVQEFPWD